MSTKNVTIKCDNHNILLLTNGVQNPTKIILCMHGFNGDKWGDSFSKTRKNFDENTMVCSFDSAGHGESEVNSVLMTMDIVLNEIEAVLKYLSSTYENAKITVLASSYGAYRTMCAYNHGKLPKVSRLVFLNPALKMLKVLEILREFKYENLKPGDTVIMKASLNKLLSKKFIDDLYENNLYNKTYENAIPLTIFLGTHDTLIDKNDTLEFAKLYSSCSIKYINEDHKIENPESWQQIINFLKNN